jgi:Carboxypeptidase regulatory-like domain
LSITRALLRTHFLLGLSLFGLCTLARPAIAQPSALPEAPTPQNAPQAAPSGITGSITGYVTDQDGDAIPDANIALTLQASQPQSQPQTQTTDVLRRATSAVDGSYVLRALPAGTFILTVTAPGFSSRQATTSLLTGQQLELNSIALTAAAQISVNVSASPQELAQEQVAVEEKQRVFGAIPNFYVTYDPNPAPLAPRQKFNLAWKMSIDPVNILITGVIAGVEQSQDAFPGYGQGAEGYAKRFGAAYADGFIGTMISNAILPTVFKQDPRYFYKGTGTITHRAFYAIANSVICKGDNGRWQPNYSNVLGNFASAGISNLYYPPQNRDGVRLTLEDTGIALASGSVGNLFQEFLIRKITPHAHHPVSIVTTSTSSTTTSVAVHP